MRADVSVMRALVGPVRCHDGVNASSRSSRTIWPGSGAVNVAFRHCDVGKRPALPRTRNTARRIAIGGKFTSAPSTLPSGPLLQRSQTTPGSRTASLSPSASAKMCSRLVKPPSSPRQKRQPYSWVGPMPITVAVVAVVPFDVDLAISRNRDRRHLRLRAATANEASCRGGAGPTIEPLEHGCERLTRETRLLDAALVDRVPHALRARVGETCADVADIAAHQLIPAVHDVLASTALADRDAALADGESDDPFVAAGIHARLRLAFKHLFFAMRSVQDALNVCCFYILEGKRSSPQARSIQEASARRSSLKPQRTSCASKRRLRNSEYRST